MPLCKTCGTIKPEAEFYTNGSRGGRKPECRRCTSKDHGDCRYCGSAKSGTWHSQYCSRRCLILSRVRVNDETGCWEWVGCIDQRGYGTFGSRNEMGKRKRFAAHRASLAEFGDAAPDGVSVLHLCHNKRCVNPEHVSPGTQKENNATNLLRLPRAEAIKRWRGLTK